MFNIILIDDDIVSLKTLSKIFPWEMLGFKLMGVFQNASDALDFVEHNKVHVILSDVAMPDIDGGLVGGASLKEEFKDIVNY